MIRSTVEVPGYGGETVAVVETLEQLQRSLRRAASLELGRTRPAHDLRVVGLLDPAR